MKKPLQPGDRIFVAGVQLSRTDLTLHDIVATVLRVDDQVCGCWRITCERPDAAGPTLQVYGAGCRWGHDDTINYAEALAKAARLDQAAA